LSPFIVAHGGIYFDTTLGKLRVGEQEKADRHFIYESLPYGHHGGLSHINWAYQIYSLIKYTLA